VGGLYRYLRNPMYVGVAGIIAGQVLLFRSWGLALWLAVFVAVVCWKRYVSVGSMVTAALLPLLVGIGEWAGWAPAGGPWLMAASAVIAALVIGKHRANLRRLARGTEPRLGERIHRQDGKGKGGA